MPRAKKSHLPDGYLEIKPRPTPAQWRARELQRLRARLLRDSFPRMEMATLVAFTGLAGLATSWLLLNVTDLHAMGPRWFVSTAVAYVVFLGALATWRKAWDRSRPPSDLEQSLDREYGRTIGDLASRDEGIGSGWAGGGGDFGGGGATGSWGSPGAGTSGGDVGGADVGGDGDGAWIALTLLVLGAVIVGAAVLVLSAPTLFAELMFDGMLAAGLYRRVRRAPQGHWLPVAIRRTAWPFAMTAVLLAMLGWGLQQAVPGADTLQRALAALRA
jgi:hypothetical protein